MNINVKFFIKNPITCYIMWVINKISYEMKNKYFKLGYMARINKTQVGTYVKIYERTIVSYSKIGDFTYISKDSFIANTIIGKFCSIATGVKMGLGTHPSKQFISTHPIFFSLEKQCGITFADKSYFEETKQINIGNDVWIGANVLILNDVSIGDGAIIGAGSVVTKDVIPYSIMGGVPSNLIRMRFDDSVISCLLNYKWWNKDYDWLKSNWRKFNDVDNINIFR